MFIHVYNSVRKFRHGKTGILDFYGHHAVSCHGRGDAIARHVRI